MKQTLLNKLEINLFYYDLCLNIIQYLMLSIEKSIKF